MTEEKLIPALIDKWKKKNNQKNQQKEFKRVIDLMFVLFEDKDIKKALENSDKDFVRYKIEKKLKELFKDE